MVSAGPRCSSAPPQGCVPFCHAAPGRLAVAVCQLLQAAGRLSSAFVWACSNCVWPARRGSGRRRRRLGGGQQQAGSRPGCLVPGHALVGLVSAARQAAERRAPLQPSGSLPLAGSAARSPIAIRRRTAAAIHPRDMASGPEPRATRVSLSHSIAACSGLLLRGFDCLSTTKPHRPGERPLADGGRHRWRQREGGTTTG